jgi:hypothetical protein
MSDKFTQKELDDIFEQLEEFNKKNLDLCKKDPVYVEMLRSHMDMCNNIIKNEALFHNFDKTTFEGGLLNFYNLFNIIASEVLDRLDIRSAPDVPTMEKRTCH